MSQHSAACEREQITDAELVRAAVLDLADFEPLYRRYAERVYRYCIRRLDDRERAADATSSIFIKAMQSIDTCNPESFRSWLFSIAHNLTIDVYRTSSSHVPLDEAFGLVSSEMSPEDAALLGETRFEVTELLQHLTPDQRQVVELRLAGLDGYEIAQALGRSRASVDTAQFRAVARLRTVLGVDPAEARKDLGHVVSG